MRLVAINFLFAAMYRCRTSQRANDFRLTITAHVAIAGEGRKHMIVSQAGIPQMAPELGWILAFYGAFSKTEVRSGRLPSTRAARTVVEGLIWPFSLVFGHTPPVGSC